MKKILNKFPRLKDFIKIISQFTLYLVYKKKFRFKSSYSLTSISNSNNESFFGYYDKSPINQNKVLFYSTSYSTKKKPNPKIDIDICIFDLDKKMSQKLTVTSSYNWQQGARCHWISKSSFIYNNFIENNYKSCVFDLNKNKVIKKFDYPVQDSYKEKYFLSINYRRLASLRADYGYFNLPKMSNIELKKIDNDGIWYIDFSTRESKLLISILDVVKEKYEQKFEDAIHKFNHVSISPDGSKFVFMHRYFLNGVKTDRLFLYDFEKGIKLLSDYGMVSHYHWKNDENLIGYMGGPNGSSYYNLNVNNLKFDKLNFEGLDKLGDGHPSCIGTYFVTDTYPNKSRIQTLVKCDLQTNTIEKVAEFYHGISFRNECRCDLHPRYTQCGIFVDSVFSGKRNLYLLQK